MSRYRDPQPLVTEKYSYFFDLSIYNCKSRCLKTHFIHNNNDLADYQNRLKTTIVVISRQRVKRVLSGMEPWLLRLIHSLQLGVHLSDTIGSTVSMAIGLHVATGLRSQTATKQHVSHHFTKVHINHTIQYEISREVDCLQ